MAARVTIEELERGDRYELVRRLSYEEIPDFVMEHLFRKNKETRFFWLSVLLFLVLAIRPTIDFFASAPGFWNFLLYAFLGLVLFPLLLAPLHEIIHAFFFLLAGGRHLRAGIDLKNFFIYVTAHRHPVGRKAFRRIALAPFFVLNTALLAAAWLTPGYLSWSLYLTLFSHATMCAGDFAMLSFYASFGNREVITYDDVEEKCAYFYVEKE